MDNSSRVTNKDKELSKALINDNSAYAEKLSIITVHENSTPNPKDVGAKHNRHGSTKTSFTFEDKFKIEPDIAVTELLGSVTTQNCPGVRTSARVIQKMKQDQSRPTTPPPAERDHKHKDERAGQKTPSQVRAIKPIWSNVERNHFFDAINEFGKDFEAIGNYINAKLKRKSGTDATFKTKDQVRQHYYQSFHKICKYIRFSDEVKKPAQEMYALINYGEMRRKLQFVTDKYFFKLKNLIYHGQVTVRCKGKNIRIKTPSCKALRRLNQLDDSLEDIRLPSKIDVIVSPANMESFGRVQTIAQNPRARVTVPLQKKLINVIKTFQHKWRSSEAKFAEEAAKLHPLPTTVSNCAQSEQSNAGEVHLHESKSAPFVAYQDPEMCFLPKPGVTIHRPLLSITEFLSSVNICLSAFEDRMGVKVRGETLCLERANNKRHRTDSGSDKRSPDAKKQKNLPQPEKTADSTTTSAESLCPTSAIKVEHNNGMDSESSVIKSEKNGDSICNGDSLAEELNELLSDFDVKDASKIADHAGLQIKEEVVTTSTGDAAKPMIISTTTPAPATLPVLQPTSAPTTPQARSRRSTSSKARSSINFKPLISEDVIKRIRRGWTVSNAADTTIGDLYVVFGQDSRLELDYFWTNKPNSSSVGAVTGNNSSTTNSSCVSKDTAVSIFTQKQNGLPYNPNECDDSKLLHTLASSSISSKLKHLLLIANLSERIRKRQCSCGHTCDKSVKTRIERDLATKTFISNKTFLPNASPGEGSNLFRQPIVPMRRPVFNMDSVKQLSTVSRLKTSRPVLVQRLLLPSGVDHHEGPNAKPLPPNVAGQKQDKGKLLTSELNSDSRAKMSSPNTAAPPSKSSKLHTNFTNSIQSKREESENGSSCAPSTGVLSQSQETNQVIVNVPQTQHGTADEITQQRQQNNDTAAKDFGELPKAPTTLPDSAAFDDTSNTSVFSDMTPMHIIRDSTSNSRWLEENLNDFSLTSLLGHLDDLNSSRDLLDPSSNLSVISESSVDYMSKFQEITALMRGQDND